MKLNEEIQARIDRYLLQIDSPQERARFEQEMISNPDLKQELEIQQQMYDDILIAGAAEFRAKLDRIHTEKIDTQATQKKTKVLDMRMKTLYTLAAIAAVLLIFFLIRLSLLSNTISPDQLYADNSNMVSLTGDLSSGNETDSLDIILGKVSEYIQNENFAPAIQLMESYISNNPQSAQAYKDLGVVYLKSGSAQQAKDNFEKARDLSRSIAPNLFREALWGISLSYLKIEPFDIDACISILKELEGKSYGLEKEKAAKLLKSVSNLR